MHGVRLSYFGTEIPIVDLYNYLGVLVDIALSMNPHLKALIAKGWSSFNIMVSASFLHGLSVVVQASIIPSRVESSCFYGIELCILAHGAENRLNHMQVGWAKSLLGIADAAEGQWVLLVVECGWKRRLGTRMWECALMLKARLQLLPPCHHARLILQLATECAGLTWAGVLRKWSSSKKLVSAIQDITEVFSPDEVEQGVTSKAGRLKLLRRYHAQHVRPVLDSYDSVAFREACSGAMWPYSHFQPGFDCFPDTLLEPDSPQVDKRHYQAWAVVRALGRIPLQVFNVGGLPRIQASCLLCGRPEADVVHFLHVCPGVADLRAKWLKTSSWGATTSPTQWHIQGDFIRWMVWDLRHLTGSTAGASHLRRCSIPKIGKCLCAKLITLKRSVRSQLADRLRGRGEVCAHDA